MKFLVSDPFFNLWFGVSPQRGYLVAQQTVTLDGFLRIGKVQRGNPTLLHWILKSLWPIDFYLLMPDDKAVETACFSCISNTVRAPFPCN